MSRFFQNSTKYFVIVFFVFISIVIYTAGTKTLSAADYTCNIRYESGCNMTPTGGCFGRLWPTTCPDCEPTKLNGCYAGDLFDMCRDGNIDPVSGLGALQYCTMGGGCVCIDKWVPPPTTCNDPMDACYGGTSCCGGIPAPDFSFIATPAVGTISQGGSQVYTLTLTSLNLYDSTVTLSDSSCPAGASCYFDGVSGKITTSPTLHANSTITITHTIVTTASTPVTTYNLGLSAAGAGINHQPPVQPQLVVNATPIPFVWIDTPTAGASITGVVNIVSWALNNTSVIGPAIASVKIYDNGTFAGNATNVNRSDVCNTYPGRVGCPNVGYIYNLNTTPGLHTLRVDATSVTGQTGSRSVNVTVTAVIPKNTVSVIKTYGGSVISSDSFINCGSVCSKDYDAGSSVKLIPQPDSLQWKFVGWQGDCIGAGICEFKNITSSKTVKAIFSLKPFIYQEF